MAYRNPGYCWYHAGADNGVAELTIDPTVDSNYPAENLIDYRASSLFKWSDTDTAHYVDFDRQFSGNSPNVNALIIPAGHDLDGATVATLYGNGYPPSNGWDSWTISGDGIIFRQMPSTRPDRYLRFIIASSGDWTIPEIWFTYINTPSNSGIDPSWEAVPVPILSKVPFPTRNANLTLAPNRMQYTVTYNALTGTDITLFDDLFEETGGGSRPFYFLPPDDSLDPILMEIQSISRREQAYQNPATTGIAYTISFTMLEQTS